ncbi:MAG: hypothetical protein H6699_10775 [Myxococcales bacterium]|nr:hypothetical protein [Myxococcales bacterium]
MSRTRFGLAIAAIALVGCRDEQREAELAARVAELEAALASSHETATEGSGAAVPEPTNPDEGAGANPGPVGGRSASAGAEAEAPRGAGAETSEARSPASPAPRGRQPLAAAPDSLQRTQWARQIGDGWETLQFGDTLAAFASADHELTTAPADFSGTLAVCLDQPDCVVLLTPEGSQAVRHYERRGRELFALQCIDWRVSGQGDAPPTDEALLERSGQLAVRRAGPILCLRAVDATPFEQVGR